MKPCVSCLHVLVQDEEVKCNHPQVAYSLATGKPQPRLAERMREEDGPCGPEGCLWQGKGVADPPPPERPMMEPVQ